MARREYDAHGLPYLGAADAVASLAEACSIIKRLWTETERFDFAGTHHQLTGALCNPKPVQQPRPPFVIGGRSKLTLRVVAEHADVWNYPGDDIDDALARRALLDRYCHEIGRDPADIIGSLVLRVAYDDPAATTTMIARALDADFPHIVLSLSAPYPDRVAQWVADELITASPA
jgi:alkanesulfonate monooxygenase SsuD/methylene tetrahydromethanopterin reductase-like flavin-dependent oxidoreductase (luciferase family)